MKTVKLKFITETGKSFYVSMDYAAPTLAEPEGAAKVQAAVEGRRGPHPRAAALRGRPRKLRDRGAHRPHLNRDRAHALGLNRQGRGSPSPILKTFSILNQRNIYYNLSIKTPGENRKRRTPQKQWTKS